MKIEFGRVVEKLSRGCGDCVMHRSSSLRALTGYGGENKEPRLSGGRGFPWIHGGAKERSFDALSSRHAHSSLCVL